MPQQSVNWKIQYSLSIFSAFCLAQTAATYTREIINNAPQLQERRKNIIIV